MAFMGRRREEAYNGSGWSPLPPLTSVRYSTLTLYLETKGVVYYVTVKERVREWE